MGSSLSATAAPTDRADHDLGVERSARRAGDGGDGPIRGQRPRALTSVTSFASRADVCPPSHGHLPEIRLSASRLSSEDRLDGRRKYGDMDLRQQHSFK